MSTQRDRLVRERAYHLWEAGGRQDGRSDEYWERAETEVGTAAPAKPKAAAGRKAPPATKTAAPAKASSAKAAAPKAAAKQPAAASAAKPRKADKASPAKTT